MSASDKLRALDRSLERGFITPLILPADEDLRELWEALPALVGVVDVAESVVRTTDRDYVPDLRDALALLDRALEDHG